MPRITLLLLCSGLAAVLLALNAFVARSPTQRNYELFADMTYSTAYESLSPNSNFANRQTQQLLPVGTVVRGSTWFPYGAAAEDAERAGVELGNPFKADDALALQRGAKVFQTFCVACHGPAGTGGGVVTQRGMVPPPSLLADRARAMRDGQIFHILTRGQGNMAAYAAPILPEDRWKVILYLRSLQQRGAR
ncbi:MAG: c-type cytochrome [Planctomycetota bacterium]